MVNKDPLPSNSARAILALNLRKLRADKGWSQEELAFQAGLHRTFVAHVERCVRNLSLDNLEKLACALGVEPFRLLINQDATEPPRDSLV